MNFEKMTRPFFSIIIPSYNEEINLPILLEAISRQTEKDFEVIVADSLSRDNTKKKCEQFKNKIEYYQFITRQSKNVSSARNFGASVANGEYLVFFDADVEPEISFFQEIKKRIIENKLDVTTVWNRPKNSGLSGKIALTLANFGMSIFQKIKPNANGPCIIIKKSLFKNLKGFDEEIVFGEDFDLIQKAYKNKVNFQVFDKPILYVSTRRFDQEGIIRTIYKSGKAIIYQLFIGPIKKPIFDYEMGGQYYEKNKTNISRRNSI